MAKSEVLLENPSQKVLVRALETLPYSPWAGGIGFAAYGIPDDERSLFKGPSLSPEKQVAHIEAFLAKQVLPLSEEVLEYDRELDIFKHHASTSTYQPLKFYFYERGYRSSYLKYKKEIDQLVAQRAMLHTRTLSLGGMEMRMFDDEIDTVAAFDHLRSSYLETILGGNYQFQKFRFSFRGDNTGTAGIQYFTYENNGHLELTNGDMKPEHYSGIIPWFEGLKSSE